MAERLARIYGTQMDKVNCPFFIKMGACRYGDSCERIHNKPPISETVMLQHMYDNSTIQTALTMGNVVNKDDAEVALTKFEEFFQDVFKEMGKYGEIDEMIVVDNLGDHIVGNVYVRYINQDYAEIAIQNINGRFFNGKKIIAEYSSVTDFGNAKCKQYLDGSCKRGGYCNYMHIKPLSKSLKKQLIEEMYLQHPEYKEKRVKEEQEREKEREKQRQRQRQPEPVSRSRSRDSRKDEREKTKLKEKKQERESVDNKKKRSDSKDSHKKKDKKQKKEKDKKKRESSQSRGKEDREDKHRKQKLKSKQGDRSVEKAKNSQKDRKDKHGGEDRSREKGHSRDDKEKDRKRRDRSRD